MARAPGDEPSEQKPSKPIMSLEEFFGDDTAVSLVEAAKITDRYGQPMWSYAGVRRFNFRGEAYRAKRAAALAAGKTPPAKTHMDGPDPIEPHPNVFVITVGMWRKWALETERLTADGKKQQHPNTGGAKLGDSRAHRKNAVAMQASLPKFAGFYLGQLALGQSPGDAVRAAAEHMGISEPSGNRWRRAARQQGLIPMDSDQEGSTET
ncbi:hypothetical protein [Dactylosporangium sp. CS-033363]|uniref:hypothetical protein n=1 Tax=Dactylosporangium sp. CS-033363 TaxID=3239935 RepID=UPI003D8ECD04